MPDPVVGQFCNKGIGLAHNPFGNLCEIANKDAQRRFSLGKQCLPALQLDGVGTSRPPFFMASLFDKRRETAVHTTS